MFRSSDSVPTTQARKCSEQVRKRMRLRIRRAVNTSDARHGERQKEMLESRVSAYIYIYIDLSDIRRTGLGCAAGARPCSTTASRGLVECRKRRGGGR